MITQEYKLNLIPDNFPVFVRCSQYDTESRTIEMTLYEGSALYTIPNGATVTVRGTKQDKTGFEYPCTFNGSVVSFDIQTQMTIFAGKVPSEIRITSNGEILGSCNFYFLVESTPLADDVVISETDLPWMEYIHQHFDDKMDLVDNPTLGNILITDANGQAIDSTVAIDILLNKDNFTWRMIQNLVRMNKIQDYFEIGDQITVTYTHPDTGVEYDCPFDVVSFGDVEDENGVTHPGLWLQCHYAMPVGVQFSNYQAFYYAENGLSAGTYYITWGNAWGSNVVNGASYQFTLTQDVPAGGQLSGFYGAPDQSPSNWRVYSWASNEAITPIETVTPTQGTSGTFLGTISSSAKTSVLNAMQSMAYGYNRWSQSALEQYLNSSGANWWSPQSNFDRRPDQYNKNAFMGGFTEDFLEVLQPIKVQTSANTLIDGGVTDTTYDKFFLPSLEQIYIVPQASGVEGGYWQYWKDRTGASSPQAQYGTYAERITYAIENHNSAQIVRLRSASRGYSSYVWVVYASGVVSYHNAISSFRFAPACVIF